MDISKFIQMVADQLPEVRTDITFELSLDERGKVVNHSGNVVSFNLSCDRTGVNQKRDSEMFNKLMGEAYE